MAHKEQRDFLIRTKNIFPNSFLFVNVLNIGSFNVNGTETDFFDDSKIIGLDISDGDCVDVDLYDRFVGVGLCHPQAVRTTPAQLLTPT